MRDLCPEADAGFYDLVNELIETERLRSVGAQANDNHRRSDRRPFECIQLLAPFRDGRLPSQAEFRPVLCQDLSSGGFSFLSENRLECEQVIVALGQVPFDFFSAAIVNQSRTRHDPPIRIGCRFSGRIERSPRTR